MSECRKKSLMQRAQMEGGMPNPVCQRRPVEMDALAVDVAPAVNGPTGNELCVRMGFQISLGDGDCLFGDQPASGSSLVFPGGRPRRLGCGEFVSGRERTFSGTRAAC